MKADEKRKPLVVKPELLERMARLQLLISKSITNVFTIILNLEAPVTVRNQLNHDRTVTERRVGEKVKYPFEINFDGIAPERKRKHTNVSASKNAGMIFDNSDAVFNGS